jgi:hypothetical protein
MREVAGDGLLAHEEFMQATINPSKPILTRPDGLMRDDCIETGG